ncbi:MAG TPA: ATP-binding protein [Kofleriaceae bacterium]|nr:ATP-binding protein [Kofleriaceae bacterium]
MTLSIRTRLLAGFVGVVVAVAIATFALLDQTLGQSLRADLDARLRDQARGVVRWIEGAGQPDRLAPRLAMVVGARVTVIGDDGLIEGDSEKYTDLGRPIGDAPEVAVAREGRPGHAVRPLERGGPSQYLQAMPAAAHRVVRLAVPTARITAARRALRVRLLAVTGIGLVVALGLGLLLLRAFVRPLRAMTIAAERVTRGDYAIGPPSQSPDELGVLSRALVGLAGEVGRQVQALTRERDLSLAVIGAMVEGVVVVDGDGHAVLTNPAARSLLGDDAMPAEVAARLDAARAGTASNDEVAVRDRAVIASVRPLPQTGGAVAVLHDVTRLRALEAVRRQFLANAAHELRTPVTAIAGYAETLASGDLPAETRREFVTTIGRNADRIARLVNDLLELERIEARAEATSDRDVIALAPAAEHAVAAARTLGGAAGEPRFTVDVPAELSVHGDRDGLEHVLQNLVDNAVHHGGGEVAIAAHAEGERVVLTVSDRGPGLTAEERERVFDRFYRGGGRRKDGGSGLGLAIARSHAQAMGGTLTAGGEPGQGAVFTLTLHRA